MNALATVEKILEIEKHPNADRLYIATVKGWQCVTASTYTVGDLVIYIQIDTTVPKAEWSEFLFKGDEQRARLKSIKLRGAISQGLLIPIDVLKRAPDSVVIEGDDVTEELGIQKYEKPLEGAQSNPKGNFPTDLVSKTDEERIQNIPRIIEELANKDIYISIKCDGMSATYIKKDGQLIVCSRNLEVKDGNNHNWNMAREYNLAEVMSDGDFIQGELIGPRIQKNHAGDSMVSLRVFNVGVINGHNDKPGYYLNYDDFINYCNSRKLKTVPVIYRGPMQYTELKQLLALADAQVYWNGKQAEGIVIRPTEETWSRTLRGRCSFKVISNNFAIKNGE